MRWNVLVRLLPLLVLFVFLPAQVRAATSATASTITFNFSEDLTTGTYLDGSPWVVESSPGNGVTITSMTPDFANNRNGWEENPIVSLDVPPDTDGCTSSKTCDRQSFDNRFVSHKRVLYTSPETVYGTLPRPMAAGTSVVKVDSGPDSNCGTKPVGQKDCITSAAVLTVLAAAPAANALRPPMMGTDKPEFVLTGFDIATDLPTLALLTSPDKQYTHAEVETSLGNFSAQVYVSVYGDRGGIAVPSTTISIRDGNNITYGCDYGVWVNGVMLDLAQTGTAAEKDDILYVMLTNAIDHYYATLNGRSWRSGGCIHHGRKSLIMWGGKILASVSQGSNDAAAAAMAAYDGGPSALDQMTYISSVTAEALWGKTSCSTTVSGSSTSRACDELRDGGASKWGPGALGNTTPQKTPTDLISDDEYTYAAYQQMASVYFGAAAVARIYDFEAEWNAGRSDNSAAFFEYIDRIAGPPWNRACHTHCDSYLQHMFVAYGAGGTPPPFLTVVATPESGITPLGVTLTAAATNFTPSGSGIEFDCTGDSIYESGPDTTDPYSIVCGDLTTGDYVLGARAVTELHVGTATVMVHPEASLDIIRVDIYDAAGGDDGIDDLLAVWEDDQTYVQQCLAAHVITDESCDGLKYDWTPPGVSEVLNAKQEINQPYGISGENGYVWDPETPDLRCDIEISPNGIPLMALGTHSISFTCCSQIWETDGTCDGMEGTKFTRSLNISVERKTSVFGASVGGSLN